VNAEELREYDLARMFYDAHRPHEAVRVLTAELAKRPNSVDLLLLMALAVSETEQDTEPINRTGSLAFAERAVVLDPHFDYGWRVLARLSVRALQNDQAHIAARTSVRLAPNEWFNHVNLVNTDVNSGLLDDETRASAEAAMYLDPNNAESHFVAGQVSLLSLRPRQAREHFERALAIDPGHVNAQHQLAVVHARWRPGRSSRTFVSELGQNVYPNRALGHLRATAALALQNLHWALGIYLVAVSGLLLSALRWRPEVLESGWTSVVVASVTVAGAAGYAVWVRNATGVYFFGLARSVAVRSRRWITRVAIIFVSATAPVVAAFFHSPTNWIIILSDASMTDVTAIVVFAGQLGKRRAWLRSIRKSSHGKSDSG